MTAADGIVQRRPRTRWPYVVLTAAAAMVAFGRAGATPPLAIDRQQDGTAGDWPTFHQNNARTGVSSVNMKAPPFTRLWTFDLGQHTWKYCQGASVWSACAVGGQVDGRMRVFIGAYDHNVYCLDARTGKEIWRFTTGCIVNAAPTFAVVAGRPMLFVASLDRTFYALDASDGSKVWLYETYPWTYTVGESIAGAPIVVDIDGRQHLLATMWNGDRRPLRTVQTGEVFSFDAATGRLHWRNELTTAFLTSPATMELNGRSTLFVGSEDGTLYACDARTGDLLWSDTTDHKIIATPVTFRIAGQPLLLTSNGFGMVRCLSAADGAQIWQYKTGHEALSTPAFVNAAGKMMVFIGSGDRCVHAIQAKTQKCLWKFQTGKYVVASPAVASVRGRAMVSVNSLDNILYGLDAETGCEVMRFAAGNMLWPYETRGSSIWSSPSVLRVSEDMALLLYPAHDGKLYAFTDRMEAGAGSGDAVLSSLAQGMHEQPAPVAARGVVATVLPPIVGLILIAAGLGVTFSAGAAGRD